LRVASRVGQCDAGAFERLAFPSDEQREAFVKATRPVYTKWKAQIGTALVEKAEKSIAARKM
jgi:TRAP-type C4-dicarboxylate transport system substrate-binding protein